LTKNAVQNTYGIGIRSNSGAAYILAIVVMLIVFAVAMALIYVADNDILAAGAYSENIGGYEAALSGITQTVRYLNDLTANNRREINKKVMSDILAAPIGSISEYSVAGTNKYDGQFFLKTPQGLGSPAGGDCCYHKLFAKYASDVLAAGITGGGNLSIKYGDAADALYSVTVKIEKGFDETFILTSTAVNKKNNVMEQVTATVAFSLCDGEVFIEKYPLDTEIPEFLSRGINIGGELVQDISTILITDSYEVNVGTGPKYGSFAGFTGENVVVLTEDVFDISLFNSAYGAPPAVVIHEGASLAVIASNPDENFFEGLIITTGGIFLSNTSVKIKGQIYCAADLTITNSNLEVEYKNVLPDLFFAEASEMREFLDRLGAVDFDKAVAAKSGFTIGSLLLDNETAGKFEVTNLKKIS